MATYAYIRRALGRIAEQYEASPEQWKKLRTQLRTAYNKAVHDGGVARRVIVFGDGFVACYDPATEKGLLKRNWQPDKYRVDIIGPSYRRPVFGEDGEVIGITETRKKGIPTVHLTKLYKDL